MKAIVKYLYIFFSIGYLSYLSLPTPQFPLPPVDAIQSEEPADVENSLRRAYFTDSTREEVINSYKNQLEHAPFMKLFTLPTYRLNYPPEEAYGIIRDQTRSTFLEEIVHPFRESLFINGFEPKLEKDAITIDDKRWRQKITVRWVPSSLFARLSIGVLTLFCIYLLYKLISTIICSTFLRGQKSTQKSHA